MKLPVARLVMPVMAGLSALAAAGEHGGHDEGGHQHTSPDEWLSMGLWSGLALVVMVVLVLGMIFGARMLRRKAASRVPCQGCGLYLDPAVDAVCPSCGRRPDQSAG